VVVCVGAFWLISSPPPPTEASLPMATSTTVAAQPLAPSDPTTTVPSTVLIHVAGAVIEPGVYELQPGARVRDAIVAAGGPTESADWNAVNLAAVVADATRIYVPVVGEDVPVDVSIGSGSGPASVPAGPVDVNRATVDELEELPGVGPATATAIVTERERNGPFVDVDDLDRVPGIGPAKIDALRDMATT
jgi:competence protein ComEA